MVFDRDIRLTILGHTGVGKTSLIRRLKGKDPAVTEKTMDITVERKKIILLSAKNQSKLSMERYRKYNVIAVDNPGDFKLRRKWREAMRKYKTDGILFMLDPSQPVEAQRVAMEDSFNYFLDSLSLDPDKADKKASKKRTLFIFVVNKMDTMGFDNNKANEFLKNFDLVMKDYKKQFPFAAIEKAFVSVQESPYEDIDNIFEICKKLFTNNPGWHMTDIHQVIVRNVPPKGLDVVTATISKSQIQDLTQYVPSKCPENFGDIFVTKFCHSSGKIALRFTFDDGTDQFGRKAIKTHTLILDQSLYNKKTALYFLSPLINGILSVEGNNLLKTNDFREISPSTVSSKLVETIITKKRVVLCSKTKQSSQEIIRLFGTLDRIIPPQLTSFFTFQSNIDQTLPSEYKKISLVYSDEKSDTSLILDSLNEKESEFPTIRALTEALPNLENLRGLQKQLFLAVPEKRLNFRIHWRFGIKTFAHIRKTLEIGLNSNDLVQIVVGPHKGKKCIIDEVDNNNDTLKVFFEDDKSRRTISVAISSVYLIQSQYQ